MEDAMRRARSLWDVNYLKEEVWGVILIDAQNEHDEGNKKTMICVDRN